MCASWKKKGFDPNILADRMREVKHFLATGGFGPFDLFLAQDLKTVLETSLDFEPEIPEPIREGIIESALRDVAQKDEFNAYAILGAVNREETAFLSKPKSKYVLASSVCLPYERDMVNRTVRDCKVTFSDALPAKFDQSGLESIRSTNGVKDIPAHYARVRISVSERERLSAMSTALDALDLIRGIWNLRLNEAYTLTFGNRSKKPVNKVTLGPFHSLHYPNGNLASTDLVWYEPDYFPSQFRVKDGLAKLRNFENRAHARLRNHPYKTELEDVIIRYVRALDHVDLHAAFLLLWGILETLTHTTNANYDSTVRRTAFHYDDVDMHKQLLQHLRTFRNESVHSGLRKTQIEPILNQLKRYVENGIQFHIMNHYKFQSFEDAAKFEDLGHDVDMLKAGLRRYQNALKFRTPKD